MPYRMTPSVRHRAIEVHYYYYYYYYYPMKHSIQMYNTVVDTFKILCLPSSNYQISVTVNIWYYTIYLSESSNYSYIGIHKYSRT